MRTITGILSAVALALVIPTPTQGSCLSAKQVRASGGYPKYHVIKHRKCWYAAGQKQVRHAQHRKHYRQTNVTGFAAEAQPAIEPVTAVPVMWGEFLPHHPVEIGRFATIFELKPESRPPPDLLVPERPPETIPFRERFPAIEAKDEHAVAKASMIGAGVFAIIVATFPSIFRRQRRKFVPILPTQVEPLQVASLPPWLISGRDD